MDYKTYAPSVDLSAFVKCYWTLNAPEELVSEKQRIVPDGCMEMIFHYGDLFKQYLQDGNFIIQPRSFVFGQITSPLDIEPTGNTGIFAIRFYPETFIPFSSMLINEMDNKAVALFDLYGEDGIILEKTILNALTTEGRIKIIETFLLNKLTTSDAIDRIAKSTVEAIVNLNGQLSVDELSKQLKINRRQLERKFSSIIGLSPKQFSKIIRLQTALKMLANKNFETLTDIAYEGDYYDQSHFIKDFKEFTGMSPKQFYSNNLKMSALFSSVE